MENNSATLEKWLHASRLGETRGVFITGTDTGVGKTWISTHLIRLLKAKGIHVIPRKPAESGWTEEHLSDTGLLAEAAGADPEQVCRYRLQAALSPPRAAMLEGKALSLQMLKEACNDAVLVDRSLLWVEGAGGFYSPLASDGLNADLAVMLGFPVLLVAEDRVGCINHILLILEAIQRRNLDLVGIILNRRQPAPPDMDNETDLRQYTGVPILHSRELG
jgi:dethiobiotin synthetase